MKRSEVLQTIVTHCQSKLTGTPLRYLLERRQITQELIKEFEIGYYPLNEGFLVDPKWMQYYCLVCRDTIGRSRCPFEGRILFPVRDTYGELVSIQARLFEEDIDPTLEQYNQRKYYHSSFNKGRVIYNLHRIIPTVRKTGKVIVTEGQLDVITAHKFRFRNVVCSSGTVLNRNHINLLSRYATEILVLFDNDEGGKRAANKLKKREYAGLRMYFLTLPSNSGKVDLDSFLNTHGREALINLVKKSNKVDDLIESLCQL